MLSLPIPLRVLLAAQPEPVIPVLQVVQRVLTPHLLDGCITGLALSDERVQLNAAGQMGSSSRRRGAMAPRTWS